jgi:hypothetical protein
VQLHGKSAASGIRVISKINTEENSRGEPKNQIVCKAGFLGIILPRKVVLPGEVAEWLKALPC